MFFRSKTRPGQPFHAASLGCLAGLSLSLAAFPAGAETVIAPDDPKISYSDYVRLEQAEDPASPSGKTARFDRILDMPGKGYRWDNPGARIRFRTDAEAPTALLFYSNKHISTSARNAVGRWYIDGETDPAWTFSTAATTVVRQPEAVAVTMKAAAPRQFHTYELVLPYGDSVEFQGLKGVEGARFEAPAPRASVRYAAYGDSITQGFTSSEGTKSYAALVAQKKGWELVNLGFGGRSSTPADAAVLAGVKANVLSVFMGANDWQAGVPLATYRANMTSFFATLRTLQPEATVYAITSLWIAPSWNPPAHIATVEEYRAVLREVVAAQNNPRLHLVEGTAMIDPVPSLFDSTPVHPNDQGFAMFAERLAAAMADAP